MQNPDAEIVPAVKLITTATTPEIQLAAIHKYVLTFLAYSDTDAWYTDSCPQM